MNKTIKKCVVLFVGVMAVIVLLCTIFPQGAAVLTGGTDVVSEKVLIPGGQSIGIQMSVSGVLVVGLEEIETEDSIVSPGLNAGIQVGDMIVSINGRKVKEPGDVRRIAAAAGNEAAEVLVDVSRKNKELSFAVKPARDYSDGKYKLGIWVKEKIAGIGTMTFYDPETGYFAALGHGIYEPKTGALLAVKQGELFKTSVKSIKSGEAGKPGEIRGILYGDTKDLGALGKNTEFGIYGKMGKNIKELHLNEPIVTASQEQIELGPAYILTTIDGQKIQRFDIEIEKINFQKKAAGRGLEIKVVDRKLIESSGGIVQGMSGSPIIQNNRIIGAITHVFVNNPQKGYGVFIEWMIEESLKE